MERAPAPFQKLVFVCVNRRQPHETCCAHREGEAIAAALKQRVKSLGLSRAVRVSTSGCQDLCAHGPNVMVFPGDVWYHGVTLADVDRILNDTIRSLDDTPAPSPAASA